MSNAKHKVLVDRRMHDDRRLHSSGRRIRLVEVEGLVGFALAVTNNTVMNYACYTVSSL